MNRTITVKGIGKYSAKPDIIIITLSLSAQEMKYENAMTLAETQITQLRDVIIPLGFKKDDLKTTNFNIDTQYESRKDKDGNYKQHFAGYRVSHSLKLEFSLDTGMLAKVLGAITSCGSNPELHIAFAIKDKDAVCAALLEDAAENAKTKAEILARASGFGLGQLVTVDYNWGEISLVSHTEYEMTDKCMMSVPSAANIDIEPDDVDVSDTVTFVWEISE